MNNIKEYEVMRINREEVKKEKDVVVIEHPFTIYVNDKEFVTLLCSPNSLKYLTVGFLYSEGLINSKDDIEKILLNKDEGIVYVYTKRKNIIEKLYGKRTITTGCGRGSTFYNVIDSFKSKKRGEFFVDKEGILTLVSEFNKKSKLFENTGGVHSCALCSSSEIILFEEDVGRHNALDKILGRALMEEINLKDKIIISSGRISSEILTKIGKSEIPLLVSRSAPTNLAVEMARELNITLVGFARGKKMNIYSNFPSLNS